MDPVGDERRPDGDEAERRPLASPPHGEGGSPRSSSANPGGVSGGAGPGPSPGPGRFDLQLSQPERAYEDAYDDDFDSDDYSEDEFDDKEKSDDTAVAKEALVPPVLSPTSLSPPKEAVATAEDENKEGPGPGPGPGPDPEEVVDRVIHSLNWRSFSEVVYRDQKQPLRSTHRQGFLPLVPVDVRLVSVERTFAHRFNPYLYTVEVRHGQSTWIVRRRYHHFRKLHTALFVFRTAGQVFHRKRKPKRQEVGAEASRLSSGTAKQSNGFYSTDDERQRSSATDNGGHGHGHGHTTDDEDASDADLDELDDLDQDRMRLQKLNRNKTRHVLPRFPKKPDSMINHDEVERRKEQLEHYLRTVVACEAYKNHCETLEFFEVSEFSFVDGLIRCKEGMVQKRTGDDVNLRGWLKWTYWTKCWTKWCFCRSRWKKLWVNVQESYIFGVNPKSGEVTVVLLFDKDFEVSSGFRQTKNRNSVLFSNLTRSVCMRTWTKRKTQEWMDQIQSVITGDPGKCFIQSNRHGSFAPVRHDQEAHWYVDGERFMSDVADVLNAAQEEIFITDWWLSPEIYLKRGMDFNPALRLDMLLKRKAAEGVKIFILLYKEFQLALGLNSLYTKRALITRGGKNIKVFRHPDGGADVNDYLWAHHEKLVVVDQKYAFVGGIDLCYGRWDKNSHPLTDLDALDSAGGSGADGANSAAANKPSSLIMMPNTSSRTAQRTAGAMLITHVLKSAHEVTVAPVRAMSVEEAEAAAKDKDKEGEGEGDDEGDGGGKKKGSDDDKKGSESCKVRRKSRFRDAMAKAKKKMRKRKDSDSSGSEDSLSDSDFEESQKGIDNPISISDEQLDRSYLQGEDLEDGEYSPMTLFRGKDYVNFIVKDVARPDQPEGDNVDRRTTPRMPWHDISLMVQGAAARDVARHFIQRWNAIKTEKYKFNSNYPFLIPRSYEGLYDVPRVLKGQSSTVNCQVLRSASSWSAGIDDIESSIQNAYVDAISQAKHYIYIENQFFITSAGDQREVRNSVGTALLQRIVKAHKSGETFRVFILLPLLPAFEGKIGSATGNALRVILHYNYASINRGDNSLMRRLERMGINPYHYVSFCSLRTRGELLATPVTELIYIHSKLMIVDDRLVICGSANINDRSLMGNRDSEVCLLIEDTEFEPGVMNGCKVESGKYAGSLRRFLMREHLGLLSSSDQTSSERKVRDCISDHFYKDVWLKTATVNTRQFDKAFLVVPTDEVRTLEQCNAYEQKTPLAEFDRIEAARILSEVKGSLVHLPLKFLEDEDLAPPLFAKEGMVPSITWT